MINQSPALIQTQSQKLSPQMLQTVRLMALPITDLKEAIAAELESNPALELVEGNSVPEQVAKIDIESADVKLSEESSDYGKSYSGSDKSINEFIEGTLTRAESLISHLLDQLSLCKISQIEFNIGTTLINNLDSHGFHILDPMLLLPDSQEDDVKRVLDIIHHLDPIGLCVANIEESLLVQALIKGAYPPETIDVLIDSLDLVAKGKKRDICERHNLTSEELDDVFNYLKRLNPHPAAPFETGFSNYVIPEARVIKEGKKINVYLKHENIPSLSINNEFKNYAQEDNREVKRFAKKSLNSADSFILSLALRNSTLLKTVETIVTHQREFFLFGPGNIKPLTRKKIAEEVALAESTISRITNDKYIQTDWGIFNLKYFFSNAINSTQTGRDHSKESVKEIVKQIIFENKSEKKLSDQKISNILKEKGISLARRTVSKYRKELNLLSSYERH